MSHSLLQRPASSNPLPRPSRDEKLKIDLTGKEDDEKEKKKKGFTISPRGAMKSPRKEKGKEKDLTSPRFPRDPLSPRSKKKSESGQNANSDDSDDSPTLFFADEESPDSAGSDDDSSIFDSSAYFLLFLSFSFLFFPFLSFFFISFFFHLCLLSFLHFCSFHSSSLLFSFVDLQPSQIAI